MNDSSCNEAGALRVALTAMKERCQKLQSRLAALEEETLQLRIERHSIPALQRREEDPPTETTLLYKRVEELSRCNSRLAHHAFMVAKENKQLWERLAQLAPSEPRHASRTEQLKPHKSLQIVQTCGGGSDSMEEVPLRLCNGSTTEEMEWEEGSLTRVEECGFPISDVEDEDTVLDAESELIQTELQEVLLRLRKEKEKLIEQQDSLKSAVNVLARLSQDNTEEPDSLVEYGDPPQSLRSDRSSCEEKFRSEGEILKVASTISPLAQPQTPIAPSSSSSSTLNPFTSSSPGGNNFEDRICPLCSKFYSKTTPFDEFNDHVLSHFVEQTDGDQDSHLSSYEIAT